MQTSAHSTVMGIFCALVIIAVLATTAFVLLYLFASKTPKEQRVRAEQVVRTIIEMYLRAKDQELQEFFTVVIYGDRGRNGAWVNVIPDTQHAIIYFDRELFDPRLSPTLELAAKLLEKSGFSVSRQENLSATTA